MKILALLLSRINHDRREIAWPQLDYIQLLWSQQVIAVRMDDSYYSTACREHPEHGEAFVCPVGQCTLDVIRSSPSS